MFDAKPNLQIAARMGLRSAKALVGVNPLLVGVALRAQSELAKAGPLNFIVTEGRRDEKRQAELLRAGASTTMNSRHLTGDAIDVAATLKGAVRWDWPLYPLIAEAMKDAAHREGVAIIWGGDWKKLRDGPHFELDAKHHQPFVWKPIEAPADGPAF